MPLRFVLILASFLITILLYVDRTVISVAAPQIIQDLDLTQKQFSWILAAFTLGYALFQTPSGAWVDRKGARLVIGSIVAVWSALTAVTGLAWNFVSMLIIRFLFGAGEAGAFPALSKVTLNWFPVSERGIVQGINFSGSRLGGAFGIAGIALMLETFGWRHTFFIFGAIGVLFAFCWYALFRNKPEESTLISDAEKNYIVANRQKTSTTTTIAPAFFELISNRTMQLTMLQYMCSNFTFYFTLTWMFPYIKERFGLSTLEAGVYSSIPLIAGFFGNVVSGLSVDALYRRGHHKFSRQLPATIGFVLAAAGMVLVTMSHHPMLAVVFLAIAVFGADMTLSPSWAFCIDIGKQHAGTVSGTMNMAGNLGAFTMIVSYAYLKDWTGSHLPFFYIAAALSLVAVVAWSFMNAQHALQTKE